MTSTPKDHLAKMVDAVIRGDNEAADANLKATVTKKTQAFVGLGSSAATEEPASEPAVEPTEED